MQLPSLTSCIPLARPRGLGAVELSAGVALTAVLALAAGGSAFAVLAVVPTERVTWGGLLTATMIGTGAGAMLAGAALYAMAKD
jgi:hypothetical protein